MKHLYKFLLILLGTGILSCQSLKKSFENRNYDSVVSQFLQKKKIDDEDIAMFEKAYNTVLERDKEK